jgi:hypothetical protein
MVDYQATVDFIILVTTSLGGIIIELFWSNQIIEALGNDFIPETDEAKHIMGQAKAMRGYAYFYLAQLYQKNIMLPKWSCQFIQIQSSKSA